MCSDVSTHEWNQKKLCEVQYIQNWLEFLVVLPIGTLLLLQTLLYSHSSQRQHVDDDVHRLFSLCHSLGMFHSVFWYTIPLLLTMISIRLRNNQGKNHNAKHFSTIQLTRVFCLHQINHQQKLRESGFLYCY